MRLPYFENPSTSFSVSLMMHFRMRVHILQTHFVDISYILTNTRIVFFSPVCDRKISRALGLTGLGFLGGSCFSARWGGELVDGLNALTIFIVQIVPEDKKIRSEIRAYSRRKHHMEYMVYMFLCPQEGVVYTDNTKARGC